MDSLTHIVLGAATAKAMFGKKAGGRELVWGAIGGSLPDFDSFISPFLNPVASVLFHRGPSHSILFAVVVAPLLGWALSRFYKNSSFASWTWLLLWTILTHSAIDCFNTYGTGLLIPFSSLRLAYDSIGIVDLILLLPITVGLLVILAKQKAWAYGRITSILILSYTLLFVSLSLANKLHIEGKAKEKLSKKGITFSRLKTAPLPLTNFLWLIIAEDSVGYNYGYISNFDDMPADFKYIHRNAQLLGEYRNSDEVKDIIRFTDKFYSVENRADGTLWVNDLRFGSMAFDEDNWFVFSFQIEGEFSSPIVSRAQPNRKFSVKTVKNYFARVWGR